MFIYTIGDIIEYSVIGFLLAAWGLFAASDAIKKWGCKHDGAISETRACDAICCQCGKNLGFIGKWRKP